MSQTKSKFKIISLILVLAVLLTSAIMMGGCDKSIKVSTVAELQEQLLNANEGAEIVLTKDLTVEQATNFVVKKKITLNLNGKTITNTVDIWNEGISVWSLISVQEGGELTITGNGTVHGKENDCYAIDVQNGGKCIIENGTFIGNICSVYAYLGEVEIKGGKFSIQQLSSTPNKPYEYLLNCYDAPYKEGTAKITVTGGEFEKFNPANCNAEGENTNFLADGYKTTLSNETYIVSPE